MSDPLAHAFLALADDDALPEQHSLPRALVAALAALMIAAGLPLAAMSMEHPLGVLSSKVSIVDE